MNPVGYLVPELAGLPQVVASGTGINYETLASLDPDVVILREGASSFRAGSDESLEKAVATIGSLGIPHVILVGPPFLESPNVDCIGEGIRLVGEVFSHEADADALAAYLDGPMEEIR